MSLIQPERILLTAPTGYQEIFVGRADQILFESVVGSVRPLKLRIKDRSGAAISVASGTITMVNLRDGSAKISAQALTVDSSSEGEVSYTFNASTESNAAGPFLAEITVVSGSDTYILAERVFILFFTTQSPKRLVRTVYEGVVGTEVPLQIKVKSESGVAQNVTAATLSLVNARDGSSKFTSQAFTIDSAADGEISFTFDGSSQSDDPGVFYGQVTPTIGGVAQPIVESVLVKFRKAL